MRDLFSSKKITRFSATFLLATALAVVAGCSNNPTPGSGSGTGTGTGTTPTPPAGTASLTIAITPNALVTGLTSVVVATLKDASGAPMGSQVVTFTTDASYGTLSQTTALTNASGVASVNLTQAATATPGAAYVLASAQGLNTSAGYSVGGGGGGGGGVTVGSVAVTATPASVTANGFGSITVKATVLDTLAAPIAGQSVTITTPLGTPSSQTATTNGSGVATVFLTAPTSTGTANIVAFAGGVPGSAQVTFVAGLPSTINANMSPVSVAATGTTTITAALKDYYGNQVGAGQTVTFDTTSTSGGKFTTLAGAVTTSATTDPLGLARVLYVAGTCTGSCVDYLTVNATDATMTSTYATNLVILPVGGTAGTPTLTISPFANTLTAGTPVTVTATVLDATATAVPNTVVTFSVADPTLGTLSPSSGTALTNATGKATITLNAVSLSAGATAINASGTVGTTPVSASYGFSVGASTVTLSNFVFGVNPLSAFGTTSMSTLVCVGSGAGTGGCTTGSPITSPITVNFTSVCATSGKATISSSATTVAGTATGSYRDNGCAGTDTVTATVSGIASLQATLAVTAPAIGSLQFVSASPTSISLKGIGGIETSQVTFKVVDVGGNPLSGTPVSFGLSTTIGGIILTPAAIAPATSPTAISDNNGLVVITVNAGVVSTPVRVTATTGTLTTQSSELTITTGIPDQDSFSLSASTHNIEGWDYDGITSVLTARLADHFNNPVPDGTAVNFTTEGGSIVGSCTTISGACTSTFTSQNPRPSNGRVTVLAYAVGEESFTDKNGNGLADVGEMTDSTGLISTDMPEAFVDFNESGVRDANEPYLDFNVNGAYDGPDGLFNGVLCSGSPICSTTKTIHVRRSQVITLVSSHANIALFSDAAQTTSAASIYLASCNSSSVTGGLPDNNVQPITTYYLRVLDVNGNSMPAGTTIAVTKTNGLLLDPISSITVGDSSACNKNANASCPTNDPLLGIYPITMQSDATWAAPVPPSVTGTCANASNTGILTVIVTSPLGVKNTAIISVND